MEPLPKPVPYPTWGLWPYRDGDPGLYYFGYLAHCKKCSTAVARCDHKHTSRDEARACAQTLVPA